MSPSVGDGDLQLHQSQPGLTPGLGQVGGHSPPPVICGGAGTGGVGLCCRPSGAAVGTETGSWVGCAASQGSPRFGNPPRAPFLGCRDTWRAQALPLLALVLSATACAGAVTVPSAAQLCAAMAAMHSGARAGQSGAASSARDCTKTWGPRGRQWPPPRAHSPAGGQQLGGIAPCCRDRDHAWSPARSPLPAHPGPALPPLPGRTSLASLRFPLASEAQNGACAGREPAWERALCPAAGASVPTSSRSVPQV